MSPAIQEEIRFVTFAFDGEKLKEWQIVQRLVKAGFKDLDTLVTMFAIVLGESGGFKKAWHANVKRSDDRMSIIKNSEGQMLVQSVDLGLIQKNLEIFGDGTWVDMKQDSMSELVETLFAENPELADAQESVNLAFKLWQQRGFKPWYAYKPGTESFFVTRGEGHRELRAPNEGR
jgi:hypothetical protein